MLVQTSVIQNYIAQTVVSELSNRLHSKVSVGKIEYEFFDAISIDDLYVEDLHRDTLFYAKNTSAHFSFWKLFRGKVKITSFELDRLYANLVVDSAGHTNLDFVLKAFQQPQTKDSANVVYQINHLRLINSSFNFTSHKRQAIIPAGVFNGNKLRLRNMNADIAINLYNKDTLSAKIIHLSAKELSGLELTDLSTQIMGSHTGVHIPFFNIKLPNSKLLLENITLKYDSLGDLKQFAEKVKWNAPISSAHIALADLKAFVPEFKNVRGTANLKGLISGRFSSLRFKKMEIKYGKTFLLNADLDINGLPNIKEAFIYGQINELNVEKNDLQDFVSDITRKPFLLPKELNQLGMLRYKGNITGFLSNLVAYGNLNTNVGSVSTDILIKLEHELKDLTYNGTLKSSNLQLGKLLNTKQLGKVAFSFNTKGTKKENKPLQGVIEAKVPELQFNNYSYRDIQFNGKYDGKGFDGNVDVQDENIDAHFNGIVDLTQKLPVFDFDLNVNNTNLNALHLITKYPGATLSFTGKTNMVGNSPDNINGFLNFENISFTNKDKTLNVDQIQFVSRIENDITHFIITSDFVNGSLNGEFKYSTIGLTINQILVKYLPSLAAQTNGTKEQYSNHIDVDLNIANTKDLFSVLGLPYEIEGITILKGYIDEKTNRIDLQANVPLIKSNKLYVENINVHCENPKKQLDITTRALLHQPDEVVSLYLLASASNDSLSAQLGWQNSKQVTNAGEIQTITKFNNNLGKIAANVSILPTQVIINDSTWDIHRSSIDFTADSAIQVHNFKFDCNKQFVHINGIASTNPQDGMDVEMNQLDLDFVFNLLKLKTINIGGIATGKASLRSLFTQPIVEANFSVKDVTLNHKLMGDAQLFSSWDKENKLVKANAIFLSQKDTVALAKGVFIPRTDSLDFMFDARKVNLEFLDPYFESVAQNFKGNASGFIRMYGPSKTLGFAGDAFVSNGQASIKMLRTTYTFNDSVHLTRKTIAFKNITIYDQERNTGSMSGLLTHNGIFKEMLYNVNLRSSHILGLNTHAEDNDYFFGKAYANGTVRISGDEKECNIAVNAVSMPQTKCFIQMGGASKASQNGFINFVNKKSRVQKEVVAVPKTPENAFNVKVNLQIEVTPDADMELIVDPKGGDKITGRGNGNLRVQFDTFSDINLYGTYIINNGYYLFTMQNLFRKEFKIDQGSTISWTGNPFGAQVNIRAIYPLKVSLKDLAPNQAQIQNMSSTAPVNCVLRLTDNLMKPTIKFDLDLPQSDEGVKQMVKQIVNTDEMMNRQILYLLLFNKFYTPDYMRNPTYNTNIASNEGLSFVTSTVSAQINSWLSQMVNNVSVGVDYQQSSETNNPGGEFQTQILYQPNNRLIINGNLGYRTDNLTASTSRFVGDVDLEYLLTESGKLRFKAYNHTVDRYYLATSKLSQGVGFVYKEDFETVDDLFKYYWQMFTGTKKDKNEKTSKPETK